MRVEYKRDRKE